MFTSRDYHPNRCLLRRTRWAFTLVELLVVIGIITLLMALLIPAVQAAREMARKAQCRNNLRQLGVAVHSYHDVFQVLPVNLGPWPDGSRPTPQRNGKGWIVSVLPQLEQQALYDEFVPFFAGDFFTGYGLKSLGCREPLKQRLAVLQCPTDPSVWQTSKSEFELWGIEVALTSYKGCAAILAWPGAFIPVRCPTVTSRAAAMVCSSVSTTNSPSAWRTCWTAPARRS